MRQSYVAVVGRTVKYGLPERLKNNAVESAPAFVRAVKNGCSLELEGLAPGRGEILLSGGVIKCKSRLPINPARQMSVRTGKISFTGSVFFFFA